MANRSRTHSEKSNASSSSVLTGNTQMEYPWCIQLSADKRSFKWMAKGEDADDDDVDDDDYMEHTIFVKQFVLGTNAVSGEQNIVEFESEGQDKEMQKGTIANLTRGLNPMATLNFTVNGKIGVTFTLSEGSGPVTISGNYLLEFPRDDQMDYTQVESDVDDKEEVDENDVEDSEEDEEDSDDKKSKDKKNSKRKAASKGGRQKKVKMDYNDDGENEDDEEEEDDNDDDDYDFENDVKAKQAKKMKDSGKNVKTNAKMDKDSGKKITKKMKK